MTKIGLVQINSGFSGANYFPYSVGCLQSYFLHNSQQKDRFEFLLPIYKREKVSDAVEHLSKADAVFFSLYVWNAQLSLAIAKELKKNKPELIIVCGGPHVPDQAEEFLDEHRYVDAAIRNAGEKPFTDLLENLSGPWSDIPSISYFDQSGSFIENEIMKRENDLFNFPSPYLSGIFDDLMKANPGSQWLAAWETNRGCPFSCTYCDWGSATQARVTKFEMDRLHDEIDWFSKNNIEFIFVCDANFGLLRRDIEITDHVVANNEKYGYPKAFSVQNTKNATERAYEIQKKLSDAGLNKGVTLAVQSLDETTLKNVKRDNIKLETYETLQYRFMREGVQTYSDMILGMPGETYESFLNGVCTLIENGQHNRIQFGNLTILPNAQMGDKAYQQRFGMEIVDATQTAIHGRVDTEEEVEEYQQTVVATNSMPREDWVKTRVLCWMTALLHFNKLLQIPIVILNQWAGVPIREILLRFMSVNENQPILYRILNSFIEHARGIQKGQPDYRASKEYLGIWWPDDELAMIEICAEENLQAFYDEAGDILKSLYHLSEKNGPTLERVMAESLALNKELIRLPMQNEDTIFKSRFNIYHYYKSCLVGEQVELEEGNFEYHIDKTSEQWHSWDEWCKKVIWWGNKKGAYLYAINYNTDTRISDIKAGVNQLVGHH